MSQARIMLAPNVVMRNVYFEKDVVALVTANLPGYEIRPAIEVPESVASTVKDVAEEMFDLTNNPSRQEEREAKYGRGRSVSPGDIVEVMGVKVLCLAHGWQILVD